MPRAKRGVRVDSYPGLQLFILFGLIFSPLAGAMAFLITYDEYSRHHLERRRVILMSLRTGIVSLSIIFTLLVAAGFLFGQINR